MERAGNQVTERGLDPFMIIVLESKAHTKWCSKTWVFVERVTKAVVDEIEVQHLEDAEWVN